MFFQERVNWPGQRAQFPARKIRDDVLDAARHQQANHVTLANAVGREHGSCPINRRVKFRIGKLPAVGLREQEEFFRAAAAEQVKRMIQKAEWAETEEE